MGFDVENGRLQSSGLRQPLAILDTILARCSDQHLDITGRRLAWADHAKVETDFIEGERDVLVGFRLDLNFELFVPQASRQDDLLA